MTTVKYAETPSDYLEARRQFKEVRATQHHGRRAKPEIEKGIPVPTRGKNAHANGRHFYPFEDMEIGDSFWVPDPAGHTCTKSAITAFASRSGWKFTLRGQAQDGRMNRVVGKKSERGTRVWRIG